MEVIIIKKARDDLYSYSKHSKIKNVQEYINHMIDYTEYISISPHIGKVIYNSKHIEVRQLIYEKHKIIYTISNNKIYILGFIHSSRNYKIQKHFNLIEFPKI